MANEIKTCAVIGTGVIGAGWAARFLAHGLDVVAVWRIPGEREICACFGEYLRRRGTDAGRGSSDKCDSAGEIEHGCLSSVRLAVLRIRMRRRRRMSQHHVPAIGAERLADVVRPVG